MSTTNGEFFHGLAAWEWEKCRKRLCMGAYDLILFGNSQGEVLERGGWSSLSHRGYRERRHPTRSRDGPPFL